MQQSEQVVKVISHKATSSPQTDGSIVFARWRECAFRCGQIGETWRIWLNLCFLRPTRVHKPNSRSIGSAIFAQLTAECRRACRGMPFPLKIANSHGGYGPPSNTWFLGPTRVLNPIGISIGSAVFAGVISVTGRWTNRPRYSVGNNRPHLRT